MLHDTNTTNDITVSAEEEAILGRFADRASEAANVPNTEDGNYALFVAFVLV
jgi:hypothetical protein